MNPDNRNELRIRVAAAAAGGVLARQGFVSAVDVLLGVGWLDQATLKHWSAVAALVPRRRKPDELSRISEAMRLLCAWASEKHLDPSETAYVAKAPARTVLRFNLEFAPIGLTETGSGLGPPVGAV